MGRGALALTELNAYRWTHRAIGFTLVMHAVALLAMASILAPGLDMEASPLSRATYVAGHANIWRLGWSAWQLTALSDLLLSLALVWYAQRVQRGRFFAGLGLVFVIGAVVPDQLGEYELTTSHLILSTQAAIGQAPMTSWLASESRTLILTGTCGASGYVLMSFAWMACLVQMGHGPKGHRAFMGLGVVDLLLFAVTAGVNTYSITHGTVAHGYPAFGVVFALNAVAFPLLLLWMLSMAVVLGAGHHARNPASDHALHRFSWPKSGLMGRLAEQLAAPGLRDLIRYCTPPMPELHSDITEVVYLNWRVPTSRVQGLLPSPLRIDEQDGHTWLSILTYRHGHFGPRFLGPLRKLMPSPIQSNWRLYVQPSREAIYFFKTSVHSAALALGSRLGSDGLPSHFPLSMKHDRASDQIVSGIEPGASGAPDMLAWVFVTEERTLAEGIPGTWRAQVDYLVHNNGARSMLAAEGQPLQSYIDIPIDIETIEPAILQEFRSDFLDPFVKDCPCLAFVVPKVKLRALGEASIR